MIAALEGPIALTDCNLHEGACSQEPRCHVRTPWQRINRAVHDALSRIRLADLAAHDAPGTIVPLASLGVDTTGLDTTTADLTARDTPMSESENAQLERLANREYRYGFVTDIESETIPPGLDESVVRLISAKKQEPEWLLDWRLRALHRFLELLEHETEPKWANVTYPKIDYQNIIYYSAPKPKEKLASLDEVDPELLATYEKLGISLSEQKRLAGVAVDAVFDSVSVATTFKAELEKLGIVFCSFSEAVQKHPELVREYLGSVVPYSDNFFACLNSAVFTDGSFAYVPKGVRCPMELSTYFRINAADTGQFERTLIVADEGAYVSLSRGLHRAEARREPAPRRGGRAGRARRRRDQVLDRAELVPGRQGRQGRDLQLRDQARRVPRQALEDLVDPGGDGLGDHLEVPELHPAGRRLGRRVLLGGDDQPPPAGRHRHEDAPHRQEHEEHDHLEGHLGGPRPAVLPRPGADRAEGARTRATTRSATRCCSATSAARTPSPTSR